MEAHNIDGNITELLFYWTANGDAQSANQLKSIIYYHIKGIVKKQLVKKAGEIESTNLLEQLPNTTSLLHNVLINLTPPTEIYQNREQYFVALATFVRWMLLDEIRAKQSQKRSAVKEALTEIFIQTESHEPYIEFDRSLTNLKQLLPRAYKAALLHYFLGYDLEDLETELKIKKSTAYSDLSTAKAYLRTQCVS